MKTLQEIRPFIEDSCRELWPGITIGANLRPLADLGLGDIACDVCFSVAQQDGGEVFTIAQKLAQKLNQSTRNHGEIFWAAAAGYINGRFSGAIDLDQTEPLPALPSSALIALPTPLTESESWTFARLAALAAIQWRVFYAEAVPAQVAIGGNIFTPSLERWASEILLRVADSTAPRLSPEMLLKSEAEAIHVWLRPQAVTSSIFHALLADRRVTIHELSPQQILAPRAEFCLAGWLQQFDSSAPALVAYLAQDCSGLDLFPEFSLQPTTDNFVWFKNSLKERCHQQAAPASRRLLLRLRYLPVFQRLAATAGGVCDYMSAARDLLIELRNICNQSSATDSYGSPLRQVGAALSGFDLFDL